MSESLTRPMRVRIAGVLVLAFLAPACAGDATPIGGGWYSGKRPTLSMDDRGAKGTLHRRVGIKRIEVGTDVYEYRYYPPDCVVWQTGRTLFGACGDRRPFPVAISNSLDWKLLDDRADYLGFFKVQGGRTPPERPTFILIDSVRAVAARQPALDESYRPSRDGGTNFDPSLEPTLGAPTVTDLEKRDRAGETQLFEAVRQRSRDRIRTLLAAGANPNVHNNAGRTPLMYAVPYYYGADTAIITQLIAAGADVNARDNLGWTPLIHAVHDAPTRVLVQLLAAGANVHARDDEGKSASDHAKEFRGDAKVSALIAEAEGR